MLQIIKNNKKYTFIPSSNEDWISTIGESISINDIYERHNVCINIDGDLIICNDITKIDDSIRSNEKDTYEEYLEVIITRDISKDLWIYNIIDGRSEQERVLYQDTEIIILPNYTWNCIDNKKMYLLTMPKDKSIRCLRSLDSSHLPLLKKMKDKTLEIIKDMYNFNENEIKMFIHYPPSTYHLHIHFTLVSNTDVNSSVEYSHELSNVIFNIGLNSDYYKLF